MTENFPLPGSYKYGKVVGRVIHAVADTPEDPDALPQARPASGKVVFTPAEKIRKVVDADYPAIAMHETFESTLNSAGRITDSEGRVGIWLLEGAWRVDFKLDAGNIDSYDILVTDQHTDENPKDIISDVPYTPPTGVMVQTLVIPSGGTTGNVLIRAADGGVEWGTGGGVTDHGALTGLADDDHPHYLTQARGDDRYYTEAEADGRFIRTVNSTSPDGSGNVAVSVDPAQVNTAVEDYLTANPVSAHRTAPAKTILLAGLAQAPEAACGIVFIGSSTTGSTYPNKLIARLQRRWPNGGTESTVTNGSAPTFGAGVHGYKMNIANATSNTYVDGTVLDRLAAIQPYAVIHGIGSNDYSGHLNPATYKTRIINAIASIDALMVKPVLHVLTHHQRRIGTFAYPWTAYCDALNEIAALDPTTRIAVDASGPFDMLDWLGADWMGLNSSDNIHLSQKGTALLAEIVHGAITENIVPSKWGTVTVATGPVPDTTLPTPGTLTDSNHSGSGFTLTASGASDNIALHASPYAFSTDNGSTYSAWQASPVFNAGGLAAATAYTCRHKVRDTAGNEAQGTAITVSTTNDVDTTNPVWSGTLTPTPSDTSVTVTASALATDDVAVTGYQRTLNGSTWADTPAPVGMVFTLTGLTASTVYSSVALRAKDAAGNVSSPVAVPSFTTAAPWSPASISGLTLWLKGSDLTGNEGDEILSWTDSSGAGNHATGTAGIAPRVTSAGGHKAANFAMTGTEIRYLASPASASDTARTMFAVFRTPNNTHTATLIGGSEAFNTNPASIEMASNRRFQVRQSGATAGLIASVNLPENTWVTGSGRISQATNTAESWLNTVAGAVGTAPNAPTAGQTIRIGCKQTITEPFRGEIVEVLNYGVKLSDEDRAAVHDYLRTKYGTA